MSYIATENDDHEDQVSANDYVWLGDCVHDGVRIICYKTAAPLPWKRVMLETLVEVCRYLDDEDAWKNVVHHLESVNGRHRENIERRQAAKRRRMELNA